MTWAVPRRTTSILLTIVITFVVMVTVLVNHSPDQQLRLSSSINLFESTPQPSTKPKSWTSGSFCDEFIGKTYLQSSELCTTNTATNSTLVECFWTAYSRRIGTCTVSRIAVVPDQLYSAVREAQVMMDPTSIWFVPEANSPQKNPCIKPDIHQLEKHLEPEDYIHSLIVTAMLSKPGRKCQTWINDTVVFYLGLENHIYFTILGWYNLHKSLLRVGNLKNTIIMRVQSDVLSHDNYKLEEFEKKLFPQMTPLHQMGNEVTCFENVVMAPWAYAATPFRCRMEEADLTERCLDCDGKGLTDTDFMSFRKKVLEVCGLRDPPSKPETPRDNILVIERKQYSRHESDQPNKFERIWDNSRELINALHVEYPGAKITAIHAEDLSLCDQIKHAHRANLLIGLHGAGLVHTWWMQEDSFLFEIVPPSQHSNEAFRVLSKLIGRKAYASLKTSEKGQHVQVYVHDIITELKKFYPPAKTS